MRIIALLFILSFSALGQTPSFVPITNGSGNIGTSDKYWGTGYFNNVYYGGQTISSYVSSVKLTSFNALTGSVELVAGDGIQITTNGSQLRISFTDIPSTAIGTNRVYFRYSGYTNYWTIPSGVTQIAVWAWGGAGGFSGGIAASGGAGGFSYSVLSVLETQILSIVVGEGGPITPSSSSGVATNTRTSFPNGGIGASRGPDQAGAGGGSSAVLIGTNFLIIAGGGGGGGRQFAAGSGGGISGSSGDTSGGVGGGGGTQTSGGSSANISGPLTYTNTPGSFYLGGNGGITTNTTIQHGAGGGGGGYYGGGGGYSAVNTGGSSGGGGSGFINYNYAKYGVTIRPASGTGVVGAELPEYIPSAGIAVATSKGNNGLIVIGY